MDVTLLKAPVPGSNFFFLSPWGCQKIVGNTTRWRAFHSFLTKSEKHFPLVVWGCIMRPNMGKHCLVIKVFTGHACEGFAKLVVWHHFVFISLFFFSFSTPTSVSVNTAQDRHFATTSPWLPAPWPPASCPPRRICSPRGSSGLSQGRTAVNRKRNSGKISGVNR